MVERLALLEPQKKRFVPRFYRNDAIRTNVKLTARLGLRAPLIGVEGAESGKLPLAFIRSMESRMNPFIYVPLTIIALSSACTGTITRNVFAATEGSLMQADRDFGVATHARGIDGWMSFYAPDAIRVRYRGNIIKGLAAVRDFDSPGISDTTSTLNWEPTDAYVFNGGAIGSTTGMYSIVSRKTGETGKELGHGRYVTIWRRDGDRWLVIMDTGYPEPATPSR